MLLPRKLGWSYLKSTFVAFLGTIYFVALRASWDQLREELSLVFLFIVFILIVRRKRGSWRNYVLLSLANARRGFVGSGWGCNNVRHCRSHLIPELFHKRTRQAVSLIPFVACCGLFSCLLHRLYFAWQLPALLEFVVSFATWTGFESYPSMLINEAGFFFSCFVLLLPLAMIGLKKLRNLQLRSWFVLVIQC